MQYTAGRARVLAVLVLAGILVLAGADRAGAQSVTTYHNGNTRHGDYTVPGLTRAQAAKMHLEAGFNGVVIGNIYAQPLFWHPKGSAGEVIVATEADIVYGLNAETGAVLWETSVGEPVSLSELPCGNINPDGITGTPVIDPESGRLYLDALVQTANGPRHQVYALNAATGAILPKWPLDIQEAETAAGRSFDSYTQGERSALLFQNGALYLSFAGNAGDCGTYHGTVIQVDPAKVRVDAAWSTRAAGGGIWAQGGAFSNGGDIYVTTGNTMGATSWSDGEAIIRLAPGLAHSTSPRDYFTPAGWQSLDDADLDLGGTDATLLSVPVAGGHMVERLLALGKDGKAYLVNAADPGGVGKPLATVSVAGAPIITAAAVYETPSMAMVAFRNGDDATCGGSAITMLRVSSSAVRKAWCANLDGGGAPIVTTTDGVKDPIVWAVGAGGDGLLHGFDAMTGAVVFDGGGSANAMSGTRRFATILAAEGRFYVAGSGRVYAFGF
jgi:outer membrane protein assembly factor BamB